MARNTERDVELVIKARDEAERALNKITDALLGMSKAQQTVTSTAKGADGALSGLTQELADLDARLKALADMSRVVSGLDKAAASVTRLEEGAAQAAADLARLKQESQSAANAVATAEKKKADATNASKEQTRALNREISAAKDLERSLARDIDKKNQSLQVQTDRLERAKAAYEALQNAAQRASGALGVQPTAASVGAASASAQRQLGDAQGLADFRATQQANDAIRQRMEYERTWATLLEERDRQQKEANETARQAEVVAREQEQAQSRLIQQAERLKAQLNPLAAAQQQYNNEVAQLGQLMSAGLLSQTQYEQAQGRLSQQLQETQQRLQAQTPEFRAAAEASEKAAAAKLKLEAAAERLKAQLNPLAAAQAKYNTELAELGEMLQQGVLSQAEYEQGQERLAQQLQETQQRIQAQTPEFREAATAAQQAAAAEAKLVQQAERLRAQLNPLAAAQDRVNKELAEMEVMLERGLIDQAQFTQGQAMLNAQLKRTAENLERGNVDLGDGTFMGLRPYELTNLSYQINDVITGLASGQPVMQILAQQGGQFVQIFARPMQNFLPTLMRLGPVLLAATGAAVMFFGAMGRGLRQIENLRQFDGLLKATSLNATATAQELAGMTEQIDRMGFKTNEAREIVRQFVRNGINPAAIVPFTEAAKDLADVMGMEVPEAAKRLAEAFTGGYKQIAELDNEFQVLTAAEREHIRAMFDSGQAAEARRYAFDLMYKRLDEGAKAMKGPWEQAMSRFGRAWGMVLDGFAKTAIIEGAIKGIEALGNAINRGSMYMEEMVRNWNRYGGILGTMAFYADRFNGVPVGGPNVSPGGNTGMSRNYVDRVVGAESSNNPNARNPRSSATGGGQFIASTWLSMFRTYYPDEAARMTEAQILAQRTDMRRSREMVEHYAREIADYYRAIGVAVNDTTLYLGHFLGPETAGRLLRANPNTPIASLPGMQAAIAANPEVLGGPRTVGSVINWSARKMGQATPGTSGSGPLTSTTETQQARGQDMLREQEQEIALAREGLSIEQERARLAATAQRAREAAQAAGLSDADTELYVTRAVAEEQRKIDQQRRSEQQQLSSQIASDAREAGRQTNDLARQQADIDAQTQVRVERINEARRQGLTEVEGRSLEVIEAEIRADGERLKRRAELEHRERELNGLLEQRRIRLAELEEAYRVDLAEGDADPLAYLTSVNQVLAETSPAIDEAANKLADFARSVQETDPSERTAAIIARANAAGNDDLLVAQAAAQRALNDAEKAYNDILAARDAQLESLRQRYAESNPGMFTAESRRVINEFAPALEAAAARALRLAEAINAIRPTPELTAFIERARQAAGSTGQENRRVTQEEYNQVERELNDIIAYRAQALAVVRAELERGNITREEAERRERLIYSGTEAELQRHIERKRQLLEIMRRTGDLTQAQYDLEMARLEQISVEAVRVDERLKGLKEQLEGAFSSSAMNAFDAFTRGLSEGKTAIESLGDAFRVFASEFLTQIARMIMQQIIFNALQSMGGMQIPGAPGVPGMSNGGGLFGALGGLIGGVGGRGSQGGPVPGHSTGHTTVPVRHTGGLANSGGTQRRVAPSWFTNAMRYHAGGIAGLRPNEVPTILEAGEEVLTATDPRHRNNGGAVPDLKATIINTIDPTEVIAAALGTPAGRQVLINHMRMNSRAIKGALG